MPKGKGYPDQFNLKGLENSTNGKKLKSQPTSKNNVRGADVNTIGTRPSDSRAVKGSKIQGSKS